MQSVMFANRKKKDFLANLNSTVLLEIILFVGSRSFLHRKSLANVERLTTGQLVKQSQTLQIKQINVFLDVIITSFEPKITFEV